MLLGKADSPITLNSLEDTKHYQVGAYKNDAIAQHLAEKGLEPVTALRETANAKKLMAGQTTCGPRVILLAAIWPSRKVCPAENYSAFR